MQFWEELVEAPRTLPKTIRFCRVCQKETPHEIRSGCGLVAKICIPCLEHTLTNELVRD